MCFVFSVRVYVFRVAMSAPQPIPARHLITFIAFFFFFTFYLNTSNMIISSQFGVKVHSQETKGIDMLKKIPI